MTLILIDSDAFRLPLSSSDSFVYNNSTRFSLDFWWPSRTAPVPYR